MQHKGGLWRLLAVALLIFCLVPVDAATYYVRTDGNDANDGLANTPAGAWQTLSRVRFGAFNPGDIVEVASGIYNETAAGPYQFFASGLTIRGATPNRPEIRGAGFSFAGTAANTRLENLIIDCQAAYEDVIVLLNGVTNFTMVGCDVLNPANTNTDGLVGGCLAIEAVDGLTVENCRLILQPTTTPTNAGQYALVTRELFGPSQNWTIVNTEFALIPLTPSASNAGGNIALNDGVSNVLIEGCTFTMAPREHIWAAAPGDFLNFTYANWTVRNNGFHQTTRVTQIYFSGPNILINWVWENNIFKNSNDAAFWIAGGGVGETRRGSVIDGLVLTGNYFENTGVGAALPTDSNIVLQNVELAPTAGRSTVISNNRMFDNRGFTNGGWGIWVSANGSGPSITENFFDNTREACILVGGAAFVNTGDPVQGLQNTQIVGNTVLNNVYGGVVVRQNVTAGVYGHNRNTLIENNVIEGCVQYGVSIESLHSVNPVVRFNDIRNCGAGIQTSAGATIRGNNVFGNTHIARANIWLSSRGAEPTDLSNTLVAFNVAAGGGTWGIRAATEAVVSSPATNVDIFNNTVVSNQQGGILIGFPGLDCYNNIVAFHGSVGMLYGATSQGAVGYNLLFNTFTGGTDYVGFAASPMAGDIVGQNPQFENLFNNDFRLRSTSPAIGAGALLVGGNFTPSGGVDLGAIPTGRVSAGVPAQAWELYR